MDTFTIMKRRQYLQTSLEYHRRLTFTINKVPKLKYSICMSLAKGGFYYDCDFRKVKCCMECSDYDVEYIIALNADNDENLLVKNLHNVCSFQPTIIGSKTFSDPFLSLLYERERLNSFIEFPRSHMVVDPKALAKDGFYYERFEDACCCVFCDIRIFVWHYSDICDPREIHIKLSPMCPFLQQSFFHIGKDLCNIPLEVSDILDSMVLPGDNYPLPNNKSSAFAIDENIHKDLGFSSFKTADFHNHDLFDFKKRLETFNWNWRQERLQPISPTKLADAGFFYYGKYYLFFFCLMLFYY